MNNHFFWKASVWRCFYLRNSSVEMYWQMLPLPKIHKYTQTMWQVCLARDTGQSRDMWVPMVPCIYLTLCRLCDLLECLFEGLHATVTLESLTLGERWVVFWKLNSQTIPSFTGGPCPKTGLYQNWQWKWDLDFQFRCTYIFKIFHLCCFYLSTSFFEGFLFGWFGFFFSFSFAFIFFRNSLWHREVSGTVEVSKLIS